MTSFLLRLDRWIGLGEAVACIVLLIIIIAVTGGGVFARYVLNEPLIWGVDVGILSLVWLTFVGASLLFRRNEHIAASALPSALPYPASLVVRVFSDLVVAGSIAVVGWFAVTAAIVQSGQTITALGIARSFYSIPIVWMAVSMGIAVAAKLVRLPQQARLEKGAR